MSLQEIWITRLRMPCSALIERLHASYGLTSILVTHNLPLARRCERVLRLAQGRVEEVSPLEV